MREGSRGAAALRSHLGGGERRAKLVTRGVTMKALKKESRIKMPTSKFVEATESVKGWPWRPWVLRKNKRYRDAWVGIRTLQMPGRVTGALEYKTRAEISEGRHSALVFGGSNMASEGLTEELPVSVAGRGQPWTGGVRDLQLKSYIRVVQVADSLDKMFKNQGTPDEVLGN